MSNENQFSFQASFPVQTSAADLLRGYLQYCKCCTFCFVTQLLSEAGRLKWVRASSEFINFVFIQDKMKSYM